MPRKTSLFSITYRLIVAVFAGRVIFALRERNGAVKHLTQSILHLRLELLSTLRIGFERTTLAVNGFDKAWRIILAHHRTHIVEFGAHISPSIVREHHRIEQCIYDIGFALGGYRFTMEERFYTAIVESWLTSLVVNYAQHVLHSDGRMAVLVSSGQRNNRFV